MKKGLSSTIALLQFRDFYCRPALRRPHRPPRLEALPTEDRPSLRGSEGNGRFLTALRTGRLRFGTYLPAPATATASGFGSFGFAGFAALRFVLKSLVGEKHLLAGSKNELGAALGTLQHLIVEFHGRFPPGSPFRAVGTDSSFTMGQESKPESCSGDNRARFLGRRAKNLNELPTTLPDWGLIPEVRRRAASRTEN
jgi:hypothetical protein